jgi:hypothetical protein
MMYLKATKIANRVLFVAITMCLFGCNNALQGGASGAALGALAGLGLGALTGDMGKGAAAGAIIGGVGGALLGDQNRRNRNDY